MPVVGAGVRTLGHRAFNGNAIAYLLRLEEED
jgi:hypothetical protein